MDTINKTTGLTPQQEKSVALLVSGKNHTEASKELKIDRGTLYNWMQKTNYRSYYNRLCIETKQDMENGLLGLVEDSIKAIKNSLKSDNEAIRLKAAIWLLEKLSNLEFGSPDPISELRKMCWENTVDFDPFETFNQSKFERLCKENNLEIP